MHLVLSTAYFFAVVFAGASAACVLSGVFYVVEPGTIARRAAHQWEVNNRLLKVSIIALVVFVAAIAAIAIIGAQHGWNMLALP